MDADLTGKTVSRYRVVEPLGIGGMGVVYRAEDLRLRRPVALKFISDSLADDPIAREQFEREARNASSLTHPNICTIYEIDDWQGWPFIVMELLRGCTLKEQLTRQTLDAATIVELAIDIARALEAAHANGIIHRDVKPANIFITSEGKAKLLDFGLAKRKPLDEIEAAQSGGFTAAGRVLGTANYMSPERLRGREVDPRSDLFSLGAVLYEVVAGRRAFHGESVIEIIDTILHEDPKPLDECLEPQPKALVQTIARLLQKSPDDRYGSATALLAALSALHQEMSSGRAPLFGGVSDWPLTRASIAVLPFRNLDPQPGSEYLGESLAEELIVALTKVEGLKVAVRGSAFTFKSWNAELRDIGARLKVETVLFGTILKSGNRIRVVCRLSRVADGEQIWSERYEREMNAADLFALQDEITRTIVGRLKVALADRIEPMRRYTQNRDSYLEYMNARFQWANRYGGGLLEALRAFERAIATDKNNALAYSGVADVFAFLGLYSIEMSPKDAFAKAAAAAGRALAIDDRLPEVHTSLGIIALSKWDWGTAEAEFLRATELDRRQALAEMYYAWLLALTNRRDEARDAIARAQSIDPLGALLNSGAAWLYYLLRDYRQAIKEAEQVDKREPDFLIQLYVRAMAHMRHERQYDRALPLIERAAALARRTPFYLGLLGQVYAETGRQSAVDTILTELDGYRAAGRYVPPHCYVYIYASLGDKDRAFAWQEQACEDEAPPFYFMSPAIENLRDDPRHHAHLARMQQTAQARAAAAIVLGSRPGVVNT
jgi:serine/threonine protein kinase/tetratricopeptide (TPR) repeat protein